MAENQDYDELQRNYKRLQIEIEKVTQTLYDCQRQVKTTQTLEAEYQEEINFLQLQLSDEQGKWQVKIQQLEENKINVESTYSEQVSCLQQEVITKDEEARELRKELEEIRKILEAQKQPDLNSTLLDELSELKCEVFELTERNSELETSLEKSEKQNVDLQAKTKQLEQELENYKEILNSKKEELSEALDLAQNLRDELLCVKSELDNVRSRPLDDQSRGNSLFAEVDDRRVQLQQNMTTMKTKYLEMKSERASLLKQITTSRNENATLIAKWETEVNGRRLDEDMILDTYKNKIEILNELLDSYKKELKDQTGVETSSQNMKFFDNMLATKNEEIENLRKKLSTRSLNHMTLSYDLVEANRKIRKSNLEILRLKNEIGTLEVKIQEMEMESPVEQEKILKEVKLPKSIVKNTGKENDNVANKTVMFAENTVEPHVTDRSKLRKGAKILTTPPIKYF